MADRYKPEWDVIGSTLVITGHFKPGVETRCAVAMTGCGLYIPLNMISESENLLHVTG